MASGFFALLDDIAVIMDDVAVTAKVATQKASGILGDDLAVTAEKASGFKSSREIPVLWEICKGSFINKLIILPMAFLLSAFLPWSITPILLFGGVYLAFEGVEKVYHYAFAGGHAKAAEAKTTMTDEEAKANEKKKIKSAIVVDFILSIEIVIVALSSVMEEDLTVQILSVSLAAIIATIGVYGLVALIVRMDDFGLKLIKSTNGKKGIVQKIGLLLVNALPWVIKSLTVIGTVAMLLVAGGIFVHNVPQIHEFLHAVPTILSELLTGTVVGIIALLIVTLFSSLFKKK
ncbi:DUF808 domain-containing protein [Flammeovirga kamogawensis]|uniref:DUF808 domain-containing protein n=1 Tax=Flammeovirga kamogawensis TaxID=373891 RepID=A0ABX8H1L3_9BACT|nr:DUF808 domain-containing protein [Flammeovirga kamogawensis]MBB6463947.1 hypothetical protein [Flammeovirga kamogawensis]QWG09775.1 DUF808 domain-containing protein [Flammeovirga kamogawensis]TRX65285.1 DUF808 domain-containing protein [Flammeovirga kamogawensis]